MRMPLILTALIRLPSSCHRQQTAGVPDRRPTVHQHPLAYLIGLEGVALLRCFAGEDDSEATTARLAGVRRLLDAAEELGTGVTGTLITTQEGYRTWASSYDAPGNQLIDIEQPVVHRILDALPPGVAVDAACGTGRHTVHLSGLGHRVIGVDSSPHMLAVAASKLPETDLRLGGLHRLPVASASADLLLCALALTHVPDLHPVFSEFARVLRPGGHLVLSDARSLLEGVGRPMPGRDRAGRFVVMPWFDWRTSDYLAAALPLGFEVRDCQEPLRPNPLVREDGSTVSDPPGPAQHDPLAPPNIWALHAYAPEATNAAYRNRPVAIIWHFQLGHRRRDRRPR